MIINFLFSHIIKFIVLLLIAYITGRMVEKYAVKVNYTRKINHFAMFIIPLLLNTLFPYEDNNFYFIINLFLSITIFFILIKPIRMRFQTVAVIFKSIDRPEDRPYTLVLFLSQIVVGYTILGLLYLLFTSKNITSLLYIPVLITVIGDGLAEPVGVRFGKHKYQVITFFKHRKHYRSIEGSLTVLMASMAIIFFAYSREYQHFLSVFIFLPVIMTITEAVSPHTWDTPFLFLVGGLFLYFIH